MPENKDSEGRVIYDEAGNYGTCDICLRTLNDNCDQGSICYGCTTGLDDADWEEMMHGGPMRKAKCQYCDKEIEAHEDELSEAMADHESDCVQYRALEERAEMWYGRGDDDIYE